MKIRYQLFLAVLAAHGKSCIAGTAMAAVIGVRTAPCGAGAAESTKLVVAVVQKGKEQKQDHLVIISVTTTVIVHYQRHSCTIATGHAHGTFGS